MTDVTTEILPASAENIEKIAQILNRGDIAAIPTETVYGLAANALLDTAIAKIFAAKNRPRFNPLIVHVADYAQAAQYAVFTKLANRLADAFWPGPLTMVLNLRPESGGSPGISRLATANLDTIAIRCPAHPIAQTVIRQSGVPLAAPSANASGRISPTAAAHVAESLSGRIAWILDGGDCGVGLESTIVDLTSTVPQILRLGGLDKGVIESVAGTNIEIYRQPISGAVKSPGMLLRHYAPRAKLRLNCDNPNPNEALLAFGANVPDGSGAVLNLSARGDLTEAAANLYAHLHALDQSGFPSIAVMPIPQTGLGLAINDRISRAAASQSENLQS